MKNKLTILSVIFLIGGFIFTGQGLYIKAKAVLAQYLIEDAWDKTLKTKQFQKPWSWADTRTVMKMQVPSLDKELYILEGDSGQALAFAPGHSNMSRLPGQNGTIMLSAHRDTHFNFLKDININDEVFLYDKNNNKYKYKIVSSKVIDVKKDKVPIISGKEELLLITCYPFNSIKAGGSKRLLVKANRVL